MAKKSMMKTFDFSGVESYVKVPDGTYTARVKDIEEKDFASGNSGFTVKFEILSGLAKGGIVYNNYPVMEQSLWKIKQFLECLGLKVPDRLKLDLVSLINKKCTIEVEVEEYNGKNIPRIVEMYPYSPLMEEDEEDKPKKKKKAKKPEPEEDEDESDFEDEEDEDDEEDDAEEVDVEELEDDDLPFDEDDDWEDDDED